MVVSIPACRQTNNSSTSSMKPQSGCAQLGQISDHFSAISVSKGIILNRDTVLKGLVQMVTVDGRPFAIFHDSGFQTAFGPVMSGLNLTVNSHNITTYINEYATILRNHIREIVKNSMVSIQVDAVTRLDRSFLGKY